MEAGGYLRMMTDVLAKKEFHLKELLTLTKAQETLLKAETLDDEAFSKLMDQKDVHIKKILEFDSGFQAIYNRIEQELKDNTADHKEHVKELKHLIASVTELGIALKAMEQKNKNSLEAHFMEQRKGIKQFKVSKQTADRYYKNMVGMQSGASYFMDEKQ